MRKLILISVLCAAAAWIPALFAADKSGVKSLENDLSVSSASYTAQFQKFYVLCADQSKNRFTPTGWMGDSADIKVGASYIDDRTDLGKTCMKITYLAKGKKGWIGIYWQHPSNNWGNLQGGYNLKGAQYLTFWARGEKGGEDISEFKMGGLTGSFPDSDSAWLGPVKLKKDWKQYKIDLKNKDLRYISGGFSLTVLAGDNFSGCTFYLAEIKYE